ncbi:MauE/DoxX family redox-associated membrane protein [Amycolatopsis magusensis]|uniref:Methylamine utilisation protein MauE domain-containing protein n=1 Tax=Amycolatopsis magusensis TaxID=882444 RepID=A0ABS4PTN8_9PSEU|nr:MauE/DoxX family redox-associated membrane protein [Amycolatopsis magusensis]MBP2182796.1 hypothetical protein [Amycolatopsis magusensis]
MTYLALGCATGLCVVFLVSAAGKLGRTRLREFAVSAGPLRLVPRSWRSRVAGAVVGAEFAITTTLGLAVGGTLTGAPGPAGPVAFGAAIGLLTAFTVALSWSLHRGDRTPCRCFGASTAPAGPAHLGRNLVLLLTATTGLVTSWSAGGRPDIGGSVLAAVAGLVFALLVLAFDDLLDLFQPARRVR